MLALAHRTRSPHRNSPLSFPLTVALALDCHAAVVLVLARALRNHYPVGGGCGPTSRSVDPDLLIAVLDTCGFRHSSPVDTMPLPVVGVSSHTSCRSYVIHGGY